ncbi:MAG: hypothetical protein Q7J13_07935 [Brevundimonas sp.]|uniref:hypothetical protein n=1 Tax=Brevundimonas sp. TaxID=1871086 RepID=UPI00271AA2C2|nr:hypothetical protein [Brevundimonas sp.]MDO9587852.1 hypothetical protein [Brevundimonas sp.]
MLLLPLKHPERLAPFVEQCLIDRVELIAVVGDGCVEIEDQIDDLVVGDGSDTDRYVTTSSHPDEPLADALNMAEVWAAAGENRVELISL